MGVFLGASTKIVDRDSGETFIGEVRICPCGARTLPPRPLRTGQPGPSTACAVIVKRVDRAHPARPVSTTAAGLIVPQWFEPEASDATNIRIAIAVRSFRPWIRLVPVPL